VSKGASLARALLPVALVTLLLSSGSVLSADEIVMRSGKTHRGFPRRQGRELQLNTYGCSVPEMTLGVKRLRALDIREIRPFPLADAIQRRLEELSPADGRRRLELMREAHSARLKNWARRLAEEVLAKDPNQAEALAVVGGQAKWTQRQRGDPSLDPGLAPAIRGLLRMERGADRREYAARLATRYDYQLGADGIERMVRSARQARGLQTDVPLRIRADTFKDAHYTLYIPEDYDPLIPRPLLLALHGGGIMMEVGASTRGSPKDALAHFLKGARQRGWFLLCPDAIEAPWTTSKNRAYLEAVLEEVSTLWNIDAERTHLVGQGGGGDGAWHLGSRLADRFASVGIAAGGKPVGSSAIVGKTALWIYHGAADSVVSIEPVRKIAVALLRKKADFVYCELPREGHGLAPAARRDYFRFVGPKRRRKARTAWPTPSFATPSSKAAIAAFGDPAAAWSLGLPEDADAQVLLAILARGQADAEHGARHLFAASASASVEVGAAVRAIVRDRTASQEARVWAAWLLGRWRDAAAIDALGDTLRTSKETRLLRYAARAVGRIGSADSVQDLRWALADVASRYKSVKGRTIPFQEFDRACRLGADVAEALGLCVRDTDGVFAELEESLVRFVLMDGRPIAFSLEMGESLSEARSVLAEALARAYRRMKAEKTLYKMLQMALRADKAALAAARRGMRGPPR